MGITRVFSSVCSIDFNGFSGVTVEFKSRIKFLHKSKSKSFSSVGFKLDSWRLSSAENFQIT